MFYSTDVLVTCDRQERRLRSLQPAARNACFLLIAFYRAMLCIRGTSNGPVSVSLSVRLSQVGVLLKRLNVGSHKHTIAQGI